MLYLFHNGFNETINHDIRHDFFLTILAQKTDKNVI